MEKKIFIESELEIFEKSLKNFESLQNIEKSIFFRTSGIK